MTKSERKAFLLCWDKMVLALELHHNNMYQDWLCLWNTYHLATPKLVAHGY